MSKRCLTDIFRGSKSFKYILFTHCFAFVLQPLTKFYILLTVHHVMILDKWPTWAQFISMYLFLFLTLYMFRAHRAHHQERQMLSIQPLVAVTLCRWPCSVQVGSSLPTCTRHSHQHRVRATRGCIDNICLSWWWARYAGNM